MSVLSIGILSIYLGLSSMVPINNTNDTTTEKTIEPQIIVQSESMSVTDSRAFTQLQLDIFPAPDGRIRAVVKNSFTLFPSIVSVALYVFTSPTYTTDITEMTQENYAYIHDLDMGKELIVDTSTNGEKKYWMAYMNYQVGNSQMYNGRSKVKLFNADGSIPPY